MANHRYPTASRIEHHDLAKGLTGRSNERTVYGLPSHSPNAIDRWHWADSDSMLSGVTHATQEVAAAGTHHSISVIIGAVCGFSFFLLMVLSHVRQRRSSRGIHSQLDRAKQGADSDQRTSGHDRQFRLLYPLIVGVCDAVLVIVGFMAVPRHWLAIYVLAVAAAGVGACVLGPAIRKHA